MKKIIVASVLALVLCVGAFALVACNPSDETTAVAVGEDLYTVGYSVASAATMLGAGGSADTASTAADSTATDEDGIIDKVEGQLDMFEQFVDRASVKVEAGESDKDGYEFKLTVTTVTAGGEEHVYVLYYNVIADKTVDANGKEIDFAIEGVLQIDDRTYDLSGAFTTDSSVSVEDGRQFGFELKDGAGNCICFEEQKVLKDGKYSKQYHYGFRPVSQYIPEHDFNLSFETNADGSETLVVESNLADFINPTVRYTKCRDIENGEYYLNVNVSMNGVNVDVEVRYYRDEQGHYRHRYGVSTGFDSDEFIDAWKEFHNRYQHGNNAE